MKTLILFFSAIFVLAAPLGATPKAPGSVQGTRSANGSSFRLTWSSPSFRTDGNLLAAGEVTSYRIIRTNTLTGGTTFISFTVSATSSTVLTDSTIAGRTFFYRVRAIDAAASESPDSEAASSDVLNTAYFMADDGLSFAATPGALKTVLDAEGTALRGTRLTSLEGNRIYKAMSFEAVDTLTSQVRSNYVLSSPATFGIAYSVGGDGFVVQNSPKPAVSYPDAAGARSAFSIFWSNGSGFVKVGSSVNTSIKAAQTSTRLPGTYQLRLVSQPLSAQLNAVYPRTVTPNGDGINDRVFFLFENPSQARAGGAIYDAMSSKVSDLRTTDIFGGDTVLFWDGTDSNGAAAAGGYYIYKLDVGDKSFSGTVAVAR